MVKQLWLSFSLLFASYSSFSWFLHHSLQDWRPWGLVVPAWVVWAIAIGTAIAEALMLTTLMDEFRRWIDSWLKSDIGYFTLVMVGAMALTFAFAWFSLFGYVLALLASETLARLDLQRYAIKRIYALLVLTVISLGGVAMGWAINEIPNCLDPATSCWLSSVFGPTTNPY
ncbi:MAG: hypothetical protein AB4042_09050 [Leptolyngbyaceae cyanobacterium]